MVIDFIFQLLIKKWLKFWSVDTNSICLMKRELNVLHRTLLIDCAGKPTIIIQQFIQIVVIIYLVFQEIILRVAFALV